MQKKLEKKRSESRSAGNFFSQTVSFLGEKTEKTEDFLSKIASKKLTIPFFVMVAFLGLWFSSSVAGFNIFEIDKLEIYQYYHIYLCDYSMGFNSFVLVGAIVTKLFGTVSIAQMSQVAMWTVIFTFIGISVLSGLCVRRGLRDKSFGAVLLGALFVLEPVVSQIDFYIFGYYDIYVLLVFLLILPTYGTKLFYFAAPVLSLVALTVHYQYMFSYFPVILALLVYGIFMNKGKERGFNIASLCTASVTGGGLFIYFVFFAKKFVTMSSEAYVKLMESRFNVSSYKEAVIRRRFNGYLFEENFNNLYLFGEYYTPDVKIDGKGFIETMVYYRQKLTSPQYYIDCAKYFLPVLIVFSAIWLTCAFIEKGSRKLPFIANACIMLALVPELFISTDVIRWAASTLISQFVLVCLLTLKGDKTLKRVLSLGYGGKGLIARTLCLGGFTAYLVWMLFFVKEMPIGK